jgi:hypothetical protein
LRENLGGKLCGDLGSAGLMRDENAQPAKEKAAAFQPRRMYVSLGCCA